MAIALLWFGSAAFCGVATVYALQIFREHAVRFSVGTLTGIAVATTLLYLASIFAGITPALLWAFFVAQLVLSGYLAFSFRHTWADLQLDRIAVFIFAISFLLFGLVVSPKLLMEHEGGLATGIINAYGDIAWHAANVTLFAEGQSFPPQNPIFGGADLLYPFMTNFLSGALIVGGMSLPVSITIVSSLFIPLLLTLLYCFIREITQSKLAAVIGLLLFTFGGAVLGITRMPDDFREANTTLSDFLLHLPARDYSGVGTDQEGFHFLNPVTTLLLPQRSFLFGIPLALAILLLLKPSSKKSDAMYILAGVLSGILPLFHGHTVLALIPPIIGFFILQPRIQQWLLYVLCALIIGLPEVAYYIAGESEQGSFFRLDPGWMAGDINPLWYWLKNTGLLLPAILVGFALPAAKHVKVLAFCALLLFAAANTWLFAPWAWDNFKLFVFFFIFALPLVSYVASIGIQKLPRAVAPVIAIVLILHMASAAVDIWKISLPTARVWEEWDSAAVTAAHQITLATKPEDIILTAASHNSAAVLAGRARYLGFAAHVWSHGGDPWKRESAIKEYYQNTGKRLPDITPDYVLVGPQEEFNYSPIAAHPNWEFIVQSGPYYLYRIR